MLQVKKCLYCGCEFEVQSYYGKGLYCSTKCAALARRGQHQPNVKCDYCGKEFYKKPSHIKKSKRHCCSRECLSNLKRIIYSGCSNPNYNNRKDRVVTYNHGRLYYEVHVSAEHPFSHKCHNVGHYYQEHRFVVEQNYELFDTKYFVEVGGKFYLKPEVDVHHINEDTTDNRLENLIPLTRSEHSTLHNKKKNIVRDELGRIIGVIKQGELLENQGIGNQQPSISSNTFEGSTTNSRIQTSKVEDSNADTSALPSYRGDDIV